MWKFSEGTTHIVYDGNYGSERVLIVSGQATIEPDDGSPSFNLGPGDAVIRCSTQIPTKPMWLTSVTKSVDDKYRNLYTATLEIVKDEADAKDALGRIHALLTSNGVVGGGASLVCAAFGYAGRGGDSDRSA